MIPEEGLSCTWEVENYIDCLCWVLLFVFFFQPGLEGDFPKSGVVTAVCLKDRGHGGCDLSSVIIVDVCAVLVKYHCVPRICQLRGTYQC